MNQNNFWGLIYIKSNRYLAIEKSQINTNDESESLFVFVARRE